MLGASSAPSMSASIHVRFHRSSRLLLLPPAAQRRTRYPAHALPSACRAPLQFGVGAVICFCVTLYRWLYLEESKVLPYFTALWHCQCHMLSHECAFRGTMWPRGLAGLLRAGSSSVGLPCVAWPGACQPGASQHASPYPSIPC